MFSQCPECKTACFISVAELRSTRGMVICQQCSTKFNALASISDVPAVTPTLSLENAHNSKLYRWLAKFFAIESTQFWITGITVCLLAFLLQVYSGYFQTISQDPKLRPWLISLCKPMHCSLPEYKNIQEISVLQGELLILEDNTYQFNTTWTNQADFAQELPAIKLSFVNFAGEVIAYRIFYASDFTLVNKKNSIDSNETQQISLHIAPFTRAIGGYYFDLV